MMGMSPRTAKCLFGGGSKWQCPWALDGQAHGLGRRFDLQVGCSYSHRNNEWAVPRTWAYSRNSAWFRVRHSILDLALLLPRVWPWAIDFSPGCVSNVCKYKIDNIIFLFGGLGIMYILGRCYLLDLIQWDNWAEQWYSLRLTINLTHLATHQKLL